MEETECGDEGPRADLEEADLSVDDNERGVLAAVCGACEVNVSVYAKQEGGEMQTI